MVLKLPVFIEDFTKFDWTRAATKKGVNENETFTLEQFDWTKTTEKIMQWAGSNSDNEAIAYEQTDWSRATVKVHEEGGLFMLIRMKFSTNEIARKIKGSRRS